MPRVLNKAKLDKVQYISMTDYMRSMDSLDNLDDMMDFTTRYLLAYGQGQERDVSFAEAVHIAKMKIADASVKWRKEKGIIMEDAAINPLIDENSDAKYRQFMIEPVQYLQNEIINLAQIEVNDGVSLESQNRIANYQLMSAVLSNDFNGAITNSISEIENVVPVRNALDVKARLTAKYGGTKQLENAFNSTKPGFFSKLFATPSRAYNNLEQVYNAFNNPNHVLYGDMDSLDKAATQYLQHCFPRWDPSEGMIPKAAIEQLSGSKRDRAAFSFNILNTTREQRQSGQVFETIVNANIQKRMEKEAGLDEEEVNNAAFQQKLQKDSSLEDQVDLDNSEAEKAYHKNFEISEDELSND